jgi:hypothetical protein
MVESNGLVNNNSSVSGRRRKPRPDSVIRDEQRELQILPDPFTNTILLTHKDWIVLAIGSLLVRS